MPSSKSIPHLSLPGRPSKRERFAPSLRSGAGRRRSSGFLRPRQARASRGLTPRSAGFEPRGHRASCAQVPLGSRSCFVRWLTPLRRRSGWSAPGAGSQAAQIAADAAFGTQIVRLGSHRSLGPLPRFARGGVGATTASLGAVGARGRARSLARIAQDELVNQKQRRASCAATSGKFDDRQICHRELQRGHQLSPLNQLTMRCMVSWLYAQSHNHSPLRVPAKREGSISLFFRCSSLPSFARGNA